MKEYQSLSHTKWDCKYRVVFIPKRRKKRVFGVLRRHLGEMFHELASHKKAQIVEGQPKKSALAGRRRLNEYSSPCDQDYVPVHQCGRSGC